MKKGWFYLIIILTLIGIMGFGIAGAGAWFTSTQSLHDNIIQSGSLDLQVTGGPLNAKNLTPGADYSPMGIFCAKNIGSLELKYRGLFELRTTPTDDFLKFLTLKVEAKSNNTWSKIKEITGSPKIETDGLVYYFKYPNQDATIVNKYVVDGTLTPGQEACYQLSIKLDGSTPNSIQGKSLEFVLNLDATQTNNPGW